MHIPNLDQNLVKRLAPRSHLAAKLCGALFIGALVGLSFAPIHSRVLGAVGSVGGNKSLKNEFEHSTKRGARWLISNQNSNGWWSTPDQPAVTGLALLALQSDPSYTSIEGHKQALDKGYRFIESCALPDGGIHRSNLPTYNTSISLMALLATGKAEHEILAKKARTFLVKLQGDFGVPGQVDTPFDGGIGYGSKYEHSDMGNTIQALEAIYYSKRLVQDDKSGASDLNWAALKNFLQSCQNLPGQNNQPWVSDDPKDKGGFVYYPGHSMAGGTTNAVTGKIALRSYGSISYGGMLSYIYADLKPDDVRVTAVKQWLKSNFTLEENPGMGPQGMYYYYHTMAKALNLARVDILETTQGGKIQWRQELGMKLLQLQRPDGSWLNDNARWWEKDSSLVTSYGLLTLGIVSRGL